MPEHANNVVHVSPESRDRYVECLAAIQAARVWAQCADLVLDEDAERISDEREQQVAEMERSFHANVSRMFFMPMGRGLLTFHTDFAPLSFFWRFEDGLHGGLIYHASYASVGTERLPVGTWSVHT